MIDTAPAWPPVSQLLPHEAPMVLLDEVLDCTGDRMVCAVTVRDDAPFADAQGIQAVVTLEYMAQCVAAWSGLEGARQGLPIQIGYLLGCREMLLNRDTVPPGTRLTVESLRVWGDGVLGSFACQVTDDAGCVASALLSVAQAGPDGRPPA